MNFSVRPAEPRDAAAVRAVHLGAFPTGAEADLVEAIGREGDAVISLVAEDHGEIVGHALLSRMQVEADGRDVRALGLGPVAALPGRQGAGIGTRLIEGALAIAKTQGEELVFVLGEPDYYGRFGFSAETARSFDSPYAGPCLMGLALKPGWAAPSIGRADYAPAFAALAG